MQGTPSHLLEREVASIGRICVLPITSIPASLTVIDLSDHEWSERPRRQTAFGVIMPSGYQDLKNWEVRDALRARWNKFPVSSEELRFLQAQYAELIRLN